MRAALTIVFLAAAAAQGVAIGVATRGNDTAVVTTNGGKSLVSISSPRGIGSATIERRGDRWPALTLRLNLRGLESVKLISKRVTWIGAVSSSREGGQHLSISTDGKAEEPIDRGSTYWTDIRAFDERGRAIASLPPQGGWFEFEIPAALLANDLQTVSIEWVDFYR